MKIQICPLLLVVLIGLVPAFADPINLADLQARVAKGDAEAELELGRAYHLGGKGVPKDYAKAADLYRQAAAQGNAKAMFNLGYIYHHGQGLISDDATAHEWYQKAADLGLPAGELEVGMAYYRGDTGLQQDYGAAAKWLTLAAQHKDAPAQIGPAANALGSLYENGWGVQMDGDKAVSCYVEGAEAGYAKAQFNLGRIYEEGILVKKDPISSYMWLKLGALKGDPGAAHLLSEYMAGKTFTPEQITEGDRRVADYRSKHPTEHIGIMPQILDAEAMKTSAGTNAVTALPSAPATNAVSAGK